MAAFAALGPWAWLIAGLVLVTLEVIAPGIFLVWFGIAAILTGLVDLVLGLPWQASGVLFALCAVLSVVAGRAITRRRDEAPSDAPMLNRRAEALVGRIFPLDRAIAAGEGRIRIDDSVWRVTGPELSAGIAVRVLRVDGATLVVEPAPPA